MVSAGFFERRYDRSAMGNRGTKRKRTPRSSPPPDLMARIELMRFEAWLAREQAIQSVAQARSWSRQVDTQTAQLFKERERK